MGEHYKKMKRKEVKPMKKLAIGIVAALCLFSAYAEKQAKAQEYWGGQSYAFAFSSRSATYRLSHTFDYGSSNWYDATYTYRRYASYTPYRLYVHKWYGVHTRSESFSDVYGKRWTRLESSYSIVPGYSYIGNDQELCGDIRYSAETGTYYYCCSCGVTFYYRPLGL